MTVFTFLDDQHAVKGIIPGLLQLDVYHGQCMQVECYRKKGWGGVERGSKEQKVLRQPCTVAKDSTCVEILQFNDF